ncbi:hypothetical protein MRB53_002391 [Persea americana]|uniref:Uncharacterized protein n=1 Tax=Persea americana TaxID=3435 RepID=A0ACC2MV21_PERAE|nr:hypothetical protein MRB53_002391 [Persea americana]
MFLFLFFIGVSHLRASILDFDEVWQEREIAAREATSEAYHPDPFQVTDHLNAEVHLATETNSTRRSLRRGKYHGGRCTATNPIDRCWRCRPDWYLHRKQLAKCVLGFGRRTTGGRDGWIYVVTNPSDNEMDKPLKGTLRHAVIQPQPLWIVFARSMVIVLKQELIMTSHKTIDGRGANIHIAYGAGITMQYVKNIIIHGIHFHNIVPGSGGMIRDSVDHIGLRGRSDGDAISIYGSTNIWVDHNSLSNCTDGLIDIIQESTAITISNNHLTYHNDVMLMGAHDDFPDDAKMQVTVAFNHFGKGLVQRMPRCRWGFVHVVNNDYTHWQMYAVGGSSHPTILSQGNRYIAPQMDWAKEVTKRLVAEAAWQNWDWRSEGDLMRNGAFFRESGKKRHHGYSSFDVIKAKPGTHAERLTRFSGPLGCRKNKPC